ncbi:hypothetical protein ACWDCB_12505 [Streptomyces sp. NPDC001178]
MTGQAATSLRARYVEQAVSDLAENRRRQRELTEKIKMLKQEEALLTDILRLAERNEESSPSPARPLGDLLIELLGTQDRPRPARALCDELKQRYPDRSLTPQVVRGTLESLVAQGRVTRHKQERAVSYSLAERATD